MDSKSKKNINKWFITFIFLVGTLQAGERLRNCAVTQSYPLPADATINFPSRAIILEDSQLVAAAPRRNGNSDPGKIYLYNASDTAIQDSADQDIDAEICRGQFFGETMVRLSDENNPGNRFAVFDPGYCENGSFLDSSGRGYIYEVVNGNLNLIQTLPARREGGLQFGKSAVYSDGYLFVGAGTKGDMVSSDRENYVAIYQCDTGGCTFVSEMLDSNLTGIGFLSPEHVLPPADVYTFPEFTAGFGAKITVDSANDRLGVFVELYQTRASDNFRIFWTNAVMVFDISIITNPVLINVIKGVDYQAPFLVPDSITGGSGSITYANHTVFRGNTVHVSEPEFDQPCRNDAGIINSVDIDTGDLLGNFLYDCTNIPFQASNQMEFGNWFAPLGAASMVMIVGAVDGGNLNPLRLYDYNPISGHSNYPSIAGGGFIDELFTGTNTTPVNGDLGQEFDRVFYPETNKYALTWGAGIDNSAQGNAYVLECDAPTNMVIDIPPGTIDTTEIFKSDPATAISGGAPITDNLVVTTTNTYLWDVNFSVDIINAANPIAPIKDTAELDIKVTSPAGTAVTISSGNGATGAFFSTYFDDSAVSKKTVTDANYGLYFTSGTYDDRHAETPLIAESALGAFIGEDPNGTWTIEVVDNAVGGAVATLDSWGLEITTLDASPTDTLVSNNTTVNLLISDSATVADSLSIDTVGSVVCDVDLITSITHTFAADLDVNLMSPTGSMVTITTDNGNDNDDVFDGTLWDDSANENASDYVYANSVVATTLTPEGALSAFNGENPNGDWTLFITDDSVGNNGMLTSWDLDITTCAVGGPIASNDDLTTDEISLLNGNVLNDNGNGVDSDPDMDPLMITEMNGEASNINTQISLASNALLTLNNNGSFSYDPNGQFDGLHVGEEATDTFNYTLSDGALASVGTVTITITGLGGAPIANDDTFTSDEDNVLTGNVLDDNGNGVDSDFEMDSLMITELNGAAADIGMQISLASNALLTLNGDGSFSYDPNGQFDSLISGEMATEVFNYTLSDGALIDNGAVTITINGVNDAPILNTNEDGTINSGTLEIDNSLLSANDPDDDGAGLTFLVTTAPLHGELQLDGSGTINSFTQADINNLRLTYVHDGSLNATDSFEFSLTDGGEDGVGTITGTFNINTDILFFSGFE